MDIEQIREQLRERYGPRNYRITRDGEIHVLDYTTKDWTRGDIDVASKRWQVISHVDVYGKQSDDDLDDLD